MLTEEARKKWLKEVEKLFEIRYNDPYFKSYLDEYKRMQKDLGGVGSPEPPMDYNIEELLKELGDRQITVRHVVDGFLEYILESDMYHGVVFPTDVGSLMDCLVYFLYTIQHNER